MFNFFRSQGKAAKYLLGFLLSLVGLSMLLYLVPSIPRVCLLPQHNIPRTV